MQIPGMPSSTLKPEELYRQLGRIVEQTPPMPEGPLSREFMMWVGQARALIKEVGDLSLGARVDLAVNGLGHGDKQLRFEKFLFVLYEALAVAELQAPPSAKGTFIPVGNGYDAFAAIGKILSPATADVFIIDPYLDAAIVDFISLAPEHVRIRLLCDGASIQPNLSPASSKWNSQYPARRVELRQAPSRTLHDRAIFIDRTTAWTVTQSFKDIAKRSPAEIVRSNEMSNLKIEAYEQIWGNSAVII